MDNLSVVKNGITFKDIEEEIYKTTCDVACETLKEVLEHLDRRLMNERDSKVLRNKGSKHTCIKTIMGNVEFDRRIYQFKKEDGKTAYKFLLDEYLQMDTIGHYSLNLVDKIIDNVCELSFRNTAKNIERLSNQSISHTAAWNITQKLGAIIEKQNLIKINKYKNGELKGEKGNKVVFQEMDGLWISMQGKDRPKSGKSKKKELKLGITYDGWKLRNGSHTEYELVNKVSYSTFSNAKHFKELEEATLASIYNTDLIEFRLINGDGAPWIKGVATDQDENVYYQLDPFHRTKAIVRAVKDKKERKRTIRLFNEGKAKEGLEYLKELLIKYNNNEDEFKKLTGLYNYLVSNKLGLIPYKLRKELSLPEAPKGVEYRTMGTMESNIWSQLGRRLKHIRASWSKKGANNLAGILTQKISGSIGETVDKVYKNIVSEDCFNKFNDIVVLSAKKVNRKLNIDDSSQIKMCSMPYDGYAITEGRKVIRNLIRNKTFNNLSY